MYMRTYARMRCIYMVFVRQAPSACARCVSMSKIASPTVVSELIDDAKLGTKKMRSNLLERIR